MNIFYPEYAILGAFVMLALCRILKEVRGSHAGEKKPGADRRACCDTGRKSAKRDEKKSLS